jgi:hypothetical protein
LPYQSLLEKVERADRVVVAHAADPTGLSWKIDQVIKGGKSNDDETVQAEKLSLRSRTHFNGPHILLWDKTFDSWTIWSILPSRTNCVTAVENCCLGAMVEDGALTHKPDDAIELESERFPQKRAADNLCQSI